VISHRWLASALAVAALAAGCATPWEVDSFTAADLDMAGHSTFAWKGGTFGTPAPVTPEVAAQVEPRMRAAVTAELVRRGYVEVADPATAELLVSVQVTGTQRFALSEPARDGAPSTSVLTASGPPLPPASELQRVQLRNEATVIVFVEDRASGRLAWRGLAVAEDKRVPSREAGIRMVVDMAGRIATEVPPHRPAT
jgi:hypothetical protein